MKKGRNKEYEDEYEKCMYKFVDPYFLFKLVDEWMNESRENYYYELDGYVGWVNF